MDKRTATLTGAGLTLVFSEQDDEGPARSYLTDVAGWYGGVGVDSTNTPRIGHGLFPLPSTRTGRALTLRGSISFESSEHRAVADRVLSGALWDGEFGTLTVNDGVLTLTSTVKLDGDVKHAYVGTRATRVEIPLLAPDPLLYGPEKVTQVYPAGFGEGLTYPLLSDENTYLVNSLGWNSIYAQGDIPPEDPHIPSQYITGTTTTSSTPTYVPVSPMDATYTVRGWIKARGSSTTNAGVLVRRYNADRNTLDPFSVTYTITNVPTTWTRFEQVIDYPADAAYVSFAFTTNALGGATRDAAGYDVALEHVRNSNILHYGNSVPTSYSAVVNNGNATAWPVVAVRGNFPAGFRLYSGGRTIEYRQATYAQSPVFIDMASGSVTTNGRDQTTTLTRRDWFSIPPNGIIQPRLEGIEPGDGWAEIRVADTYI